jgi:hypothetical protein
MLVLDHTRLDSPTMDEPFIRLTAGTRSPERTTRIGTSAVREVPVRPRARAAERVRAWKRPSPCARPSSRASSRSESLPPEKMFARHAVRFSCSRRSFRSRGMVRHWAGPAAGLSPRRWSPSSRTWSRTRAWCIRTSRQRSDSSERSLSPWLSKGGRFSWGLTGLALGLREQVLGLPRPDRFRDRAAGSWSGGALRRNRRHDLLPLRGLFCRSHLLLRSGRVRGRDAVDGALRGGSRGTDLP